MTLHASCSLLASLLLVALFLATAHAGDGTLPYTAPPNANGMWGGFSTQKECIDVFQHPICFNQGIICRPNYISRYGRSKCDSYTANSDSCFDAKRICKVK